MLGQFKIIGGDFSLDAKHQFTRGVLHLVPVGGWGFKTVKYPTERVVAVEQFEADTDRKVGSTIGWGIGGALLAGPLGAAALGYLGGKSNDVVFACELDDGKKFVGVMKRRTFIDFTAPLALRD
jgi:hypothetical protein